MTESPYQSILDHALKVASDTKHLAIGRDNAADAARLFKLCFPEKKALVVADRYTFHIYGKSIFDALQAAGIDCDKPFIFEDPAIYAEYKYVDQLEEALRHTDAIPVAVGSGTINDVVKLAACHFKRRYMCVATAASMDGYTAFGASITLKGSKQTFNCPAPLAVVADLNVIAQAPPSMNASGYADLLAKLPAGADWIVADALGIEPIDEPAWEMVQGNLRAWLDNPEGIATGDPVALEALVAGLMMGGFAMQHLQNSRPASGAEHQFSHLWDMQAHKHNGESVSHGFKVGIGTLASSAMYEFLYTQPLESLDIEAAVGKWPGWEELEAEINSLFTVEEIRLKALEEEREKYVTTEELRQQLQTLKQCWPELKARLQKHLPSQAELADMLARAGAPSSSEAIGISREDLEEAYRKSLHIRRRYTVLDLVHRTGLYDNALSSFFQSTSAKV